MFSVVIGDMFASPAQTLVNTVNCVGVMGKGVALEFKKRFPAMFDDYQRRCANKEVHLGEPYLYRDLSGLRVVNFPTKDHWRASARLMDIEKGLDYFAAHAADWAITSVAMPPLGCGNGGLAWSEVGPLIYRALRDLPIDIEVFAPYGTPRQELELAFLEAPTQMTLSGKGRKLAKLNPNWAVLMEVLLRLQEQPYANPVGRTIFQKICYIVTEMGVQTDFDFGKGNYGPFSTGVREALHEFANRNWIKEEPLGRMLELHVNPQYLRDRSKFKEEIERSQKKIDKAVDLFSRIKSTEQAEEVMTVLYASREVKRAHPEEEITEQQLFDYVLGWKKSWDKEDKKRTVAVTIRNLVTLGWMRVKICESTHEGEFAEEVA